MNLRKKKKGFTLIELMAVIAIIAILAAVLVPTVTGYINRSKKTAIVTECRTVMNAVETYNTSTLSPIAMDSTTIETAIGTNGVLEQLVDEEFINENNIKHIKAATLAEVKEINDNEDKDIINRIQINDDGTFKSLD